MKVPEKPTTNNGNETNASFRAFAKTGLCKKRNLVNPNPIIALSIEPIKMAIIASVELRESNQSKERTNVITEGLVSRNAYKRNLNTPRKWLDIMDVIVVKGKDTP